MAIDAGRRDFLKWLGVAGVSGALALANAKSAFADTVLANNSITTPAITAPTGRSASYILAASNSSAKSKAQSDDVCTGTNDEVKIAAAIATLPVAGGKILLLEGTYVKGNVTGISVPSNTEIEIDGTIQLVTNVGDGAVVFVNSDIVNGNSGIHIHGKKLDGNRANQSTGIQHGITFTNVSNSKIDIEISGFRDLAVVCTTCSNVEVRNKLYPYANPLETVEPFLSSILRNRNV